MRNNWLPHTYNLKTNITGKPNESPVLAFNRRYSPRIASEYANKTLTVRKQCSVASPLTNGNLNWWYHQYGTKRANSVRNAELNLNNAVSKKKRFNLEKNIMVNENKRVKSNERNKFNEVLKKRKGLSQLAKVVKSFSENELQRAKVRNKSKYVANYSQVIPRLKSKRSSSKKKKIPKLSPIKEELEYNLSLLNENSSRKIPRSSRK